MTTGEADDGLLRHAFHRIDQDHLRTMREQSENLHPRQHIATSRTIVCWSEMGMATSVPPPPARHSSNGRLCAAGLHSLTRLSCSVRTRVDWFTGSSRIDTGTAPGAAAGTSTNAAENPSTRGRHASNGGRKGVSKATDRTGTCEAVHSSADRRKPI